MYTLGHMLELAVQRYPCRPALVDPEEEEHLTYRDWNAAVNRLAHALLKLGVTKGDRVSAFLPNCCELATLLFATAKVGAVFNPVNCNFSPSELAFILNDADSKVLAFGPGEKERVTKAVPKIEAVSHYLYAGEDPPPFAQDLHRLAGDFPAENPGVSVSESDWYSIIYTSGTTGRPKGVIHRHREIMDHSMCMIASQQLTCNDRGLSVSPLYHAAELHCFFLPRVHAGACNILLKTSEPGPVVQVLREQEISVLFAGPAVWASLLQWAGKSLWLPRVRLLASGGAPVPPAVAAGMHKVFGVSPTHYYGMTEMGPAVAVLGPQDPPGKAGSAGLPLLNHEIRVVRPGGVLPADPENTLGPGTVGEIIVRGRGMMQGYYNRPELTAEALYGGWYHTGDLGCLDEDGYLWVFDRVDDMIIRGVDKVYPREIEEVILEHPAVRDAAVFGVTSGQGKEEIMALVVAEGSLSGRELHEFLRLSDRLASFKLPDRYEFVTGIPRLTTGKVPRKRLARKYKGL